MQIRYYLAAGVAALSIASMSATPAFAQETTSSVRGTVESASGPVAGATVTIVHEPSGTTATSTTDADGGFSASGLRVGGPFSVTVDADGFQSAQITDISLSAGQSFRLPVTLEAQQEIVVTASALRGATEKSNGPITALGREDIEGVASINRDIRDIARRDPFVTIDLANSRTIEVAGQNGRLNRFSVDGVQFSDDFGLNNGGLPTSRGPVPFDAIEQLSVKVAPYDISEGDFQGGAINVVLRSGTNSFTGSAFFTYTDENLTGNQTLRRNLRVSPTNPNGEVRLKFDSKQYGGILAGPIIKDKLFFMVGYEKTKETDPFDDGVGASYANQVPGITEPQLTQISGIAQSVYSYDTLGQIQNATEEDEKIVAKLDWNVNDDHRVSLNYIRNVGTQQFQQNTFTTPPFSLGLFSNGYELAEEVNSGVFQLNSQWSDGFSTELRASYRDYNRDQTPFGGREFPQFEVCLDPTSITNLATNNFITCGGSRVFFGPDVSRQSNALNTDNLSIDFTAKKEAGDHLIKATFGYSEINTFNLFLQRSIGDYYFDSIADFQNRTANRLRFGAAVPSLDPNDAAANFKSRAYTFGIQDDWEVLPGLDMTFGFRYDLYENPTGVPLNPNFLARQGFTNRNTFNGEGVFQPRFGFNWQASDRLTIRGGIGIFAGGTPDVFLSNSYSNTGQLTNAIDIQRNTSAATCNLTPANPALCATALTGVTGDIPGAIETFVATNTAALAAAPVNAIDPNIRVARQARATLSAAYDADLGPLGDGWLFGIDALWGNVIDAYQWTDRRSVRIGTLPDGRPRYAPLGGTATTNQDLLMTNDTRGRSYVAVARVSKSWDWGLSFDLSYTRSDIKDTNAITSATAGSLYSNNAFADPNFAAYGTSIYQIKDQWKFGIDFNRALFGDNKTRFSLFGEYRSGRPYSLTMNDQSNRSAVFGTVGNGARHLLYVPTVGDTRVSFDTAANETLFNSLVDSLGISKFRGSILKKNTQQAPDFFKVDLGISQELPLFVGNSKIKLFADIENVLNLIDSDWGSLRQVVFPQTAPLVTVQCLSVAQPTGQGVVNIGTAAAQNPSNLPAVGNANSGQTCAQYRYSNVRAPDEALSARQSLYGIRVGVKISF
jgi:Carboxypeptidase regulatory-like domain